MTDEARKIHLASLRDRIASLRVVKCRMSHERVVGVHGAAGRGDHQGPPPPFSRVGLCSPAERAERLGCSHTMSRVMLDEAIRQLGREKAEQLGQELNLLTNEIHLLDHRKGEAEARLAAARRKAGRGTTGALQVAKEVGEVWRLERRHDEYVERVGVLRDAVVSEIERLLGQDEP